MSSDLKERLRSIAGVSKDGNAVKVCLIAAARITELEDALRALLEDSEGCYPTQTAFNRARKALGDKS
jgi:hypothetical protein